jgi:hypothetical protein
MAANDSDRTGGLSVEDYCRTDSAQPPAAQHDPQPRDSRNTPYREYSIRVSTTALWA